jgi:D-galactarolactone cycloisomerase
MSNETRHERSTMSTQGPSRRDWLRTAVGCAAAGTLTGLWGSSAAEAAAEANCHNIKVRDVKYYCLKANLTEPFAWPDGHATSRNASVVRIETDQGIVGWGEGGGAAKEVDAVRQIILNQSPFDTWRLGQRLMGNKVSLGMRGAVDSALWDIKGKVLGMPIHQLLGGALRNRIFAYATAGYYGYPEDSLDWLKEKTQSIAREGFRYFKMKAGIKNFDYERNRMDVVQQTMGPNCRVAVDSTTMLTVESALIFGRELEARNIWWFEDPLPSQDVAGYKRLSQELKIPIVAHYGAGRNLEEYVKNEAVAQVNTWVGNAGGFSDCQYQIAITSLHGILLRPNCWSTHLQIAQALHLHAIIPSRSESPDQDGQVLEFDRSANPLREDTILTEPIRLEADGTVKVPNGPGLGVEVDEDKLKKYAVNIV